MEKGIEMWNWVVNFLGKIANEIGSWVGATAWILGKAMLGAILGIAAGKHGIAFVAFVSLITADWLIKRYAVCRRYVSDQCSVPIHKVDIRTAIRAWNVARGEGYWESSKMRNGSSKLITYMIGGGGIAAIVDILTSNVAGEDLFTNIVLCYFGLTEAESILENLKEAGVVKAAEVCEIIENKKTQFLGITKKEESKK